MAIFYAYINGTRFVDGVPGISTRVLLTCESRYVADELFRFLESLQHQDGSEWFASLSRRTPQFWHFDTYDDNPHTTIMHVLTSNRFLYEFRTTVMPKSLGNSSDTSPVWPIIPVVDGPDWVHNRAYFIRTRQRPDRYWHMSGVDIVVSETKRSKFHIRRVAFAKDGLKSLIRSDRIQIHPLEKYFDSLLPIGMSQNRLTRTRTPGDWQFGKLLGGFKESGSAGERFVESTVGDDGDDWELC